MNALLRPAALLLAAPLLLLALLLSLVLADAAGLLALLLLGRRGYHRLIVVFSRGLCAVLQALTGTTLRVQGLAPAATAAPYIVVANHQPPLDILLLGLCFGEQMLAFVARRGIPGLLPMVGLYMAVTGSARVAEQGADREDSRQMHALARRVRRQGGGVALFPEGLTAWGREARQRRFRRAGLRRLMRALPEAALVPVVFDGCDRLFSGWKGLPRCGQAVEIALLPPIAADSGSIEDRITACEQAIHREQALRIARRGAWPAPAGVATGSRNAALP